MMTLMILATPPRGLLGEVAHPEASMPYTPPLLYEVAHPEASTAYTGGGCAILRAHARWPTRRRLQPKQRSARATRQL